MCSLRNFWSNLFNFLLEFQSHFLIDDDDEEFFWKAFKYRTSKRFSQMMSDIREGVDTTHEWLIPAYKKLLEKYWETDEK